TPKGAEEAAKWLAFKRYMENLEQYTKVEEAQEIFDRYLPYAIAFGLEKSWIEKFAKVNTAPPPWFYPGPYLGPRPRRYIWWTGAGYGPIGSGGGGMSPSEGGSMAPPSMSDMSRGMGASLASMSAGLGAMLTSSSNALSSRPAPQAGSGSWGSRSWSGGSGFGGGGWSGGGGFGGGGGGGSSFG
ncbi:MAG: DUF2207 domain-containing protein, partial [Anaerolineae bacterium]|nr:DUF2207 domain-containing protein [Anaerolineae bacterium]